MYARLMSAAIGLAAVALAPASVTASVDILDPSDGGNQPPPGVLCVDVFVDVTSDDTWTAGGMDAFAQNGASLRYATDPSGNIVLTNPGTNNRFVTFFSKPRPRDADSRYVNGGVNGVAMVPPTVSQVSAAFYAVPPETAGSPSVDGYVFRLAIDLPAGTPPLQVFEGAAPPDALLVSRPRSGTTDQYGTVNATFDVPALTGINWYVAPIPEPATLVLLALLGLAAFRRS